MVTLYGIKNCDTVKKARLWLDQNQIEYHFHDFRLDGINPTQVKNWLNQLGWETLINKRSTTWKSLPEESKKGLNNQSAIEAIIAHPTLIKRPLLEVDKQFKVGFNAADYQQIFM